MIFINKVEPPAVLLVDPDFDQCRRSKSELESQGYKVVCAHSGEEAIITFAHKKIDAIVVEAFLPDMHVLDFIDEVAAKRHRKVPIIINEACPTYRHNFRYWAADAIIEKTTAGKNHFAQIEALL